VKPRIQFRAMVPSDYAEFTEATSYYPGPQFGGIVAFTDRSTMGMVGFDHWTKTAVTAHWCITQPRCIVPLWNEVLDYLSRHNRYKIIGTTPSDNVRGLRMIFGKLGWIELGRIKDGWDIGVDIVISEFNIPARAERMVA